MEASRTPGQNKKVLLWVVLPHLGWSPEEQFMVRPVGQSLERPLTVNPGIGDVESGTVPNLGGGPCRLRSQETLTPGKRLLLRATHARARTRSQVLTASQVEGGISASLLFSFVF